MNVEQIIDEMKKIDTLASDNNDSLMRINQMLAEIESEARYFRNQKAGQDLAYTTNSAIKICCQAQSSFASVKKEANDYIIQLKK